MKYKYIYIYVLLVTKSMMIYLSRKNKKTLGGCLGKVMVSGPTALKSLMLRFVSGTRRRCPKKVDPNGMEDMEVTDLCGFEMV